MTQARFRLGIDFGTSTTVAVLRRPDGRVQQLLFDGSPLLSSAVLLGPDGRLHTGRDAAHLARSAPERLEPNPKRRAGETTVLLGDAEVDARDLIAAVLRRVATEAGRVAGTVEAVTLTHPADWGTARRELLVQAARLAGFAGVTLVPEPVAAAAYLATTQDVPVGACVVVYDLGAGTCDVTVLRRARHSFEQVASTGLNDLGGLDVDAAVVGFLEATYGTLWTDLTTRRQLWDDVRTAKEMLSRASGTVVMVPALGREVPLGREQLEGLMRPVLRPSVAMTRALLADTDVTRAEIAGLFLVGGSSRIPLVATMLHEALGIAPVVAEQPELVVAEGSLHGTTAATDAGAPPQPQPQDAAPEGPQASRPLPRRRRSRTRLLAAAAAIAVVLAGGAVLLSQLDLGGGDDQSQQRPDPTGPAVRYTLSKMPDDLCASIDLTPFAGIYEQVAERPRPTRNLGASGGEAACLMVLRHGTVRATFAASVRVTPEQSAAVAEYTMLIGADAALNDRPESLTGLGDEAVVFEMKGTTAQAKTEMTLRIGVRDGNLTWHMRLTVDRQDQAGWTAAQRQDHRTRFVGLTRAALPKVTANLT